MAAATAQARPLSGIAAQHDQGLAFQQAVRMIQAQDLNGGRANVAQRLDQGAFEAKVLVPLIFAGMKQAGKWLIRRQVSAKVTAFIAIAGEAAVGKIIEVMSAVVFEADNMIHLMREKAVGFMQKAILAPVVRPRFDDKSLSGRDPATQGISF